MKGQEIELCAGAMIFDKEGKMFLMRTPKYGDVLIVPGGHVEQDEPIRDAVVREVKEETRLDVEDLEFFEIQEAIDDPDIAPGRHFVFVDYLCRAKGKDVVLDKTEGTEYMWIEPEDALLRQDLGKATRRFIRNYLDSGYIRQFKKLHDIEVRLRKECPWDRKQTLATLQKDLLEEADELREAVEEIDKVHIREEMGDVIQCLVLMSIVAEEQGISLHDSLEEVSEKLIRRHPHVFGELKGRELTAEQVTENWKLIKEEEKRMKEKL